MAWIALSSTDIETALTGQELTAYREAALANGQGDPLPELLDRAVRLVRGYVAACDDNHLGAGNTIPDELEGATVALVAHGLDGRLPLPSSLTERLDRRYDDAMRQLRDVAACKFALAQPAIPTTEVIGGGSVKVVNSRPRMARGSDLNGL